MFDVEFFLLLRNILLGELLKILGFSGFVCFFFFNGIFLMIVDDCNEFFDELVGFFVVKVFFGGK